MTDSWKIESMYLLLAFRDGGPRWAWVPPVTRFRLISPATIRGSGIPGRIVARSLRSTTASPPFTTYFAYVRTTLSEGTVRTFENCFSLLQGSCTCLSRRITQFTAWSTMVGAYMRTHRRRRWPHVKEYVCTHRDDTRKKEIEEGGREGEREREQGTRGRVHVYTQHTRKREVARAGALAS